MITALVKFSLAQRLFILMGALIIGIGGWISFRQLPIEAYPDVADTWVQIITQWPGHAAEEVERQITIPTERVMNGVAKRTAVRSTSIAGLSVVTLIFEDGRLGVIDLTRNGFYGYDISTELLGTADEQHGDSLLKRESGPRDDLAGSEVAAHRVDRDRSYELHELVTSDASAWFT